MNVRTGDGVRLHVDVHGDADADVTVVLAHGWTQSKETWRYQARDLPREAGADVRVVRYDHRGHGRSDGMPECDATIDNLARDLASVIDHVAPEGSLVLAGHSMGGMAMMALAEQRPELFVDRVAGAAFVSTSGGGLDTVTLGLPTVLGARLRERLPRLLAARARMLQRATRNRPSTLESRIVRRLLFGTPVRPEDHRTVLQDLVATPADSMCGYLTDLMLHDRGTALAALQAVPTRVLVGARDRLTPTSHARRLAELVPAAELQVLPGAGHMLPLERDRAVTSALARLVRRQRQWSSDPSRRSEVQGA